MKIICQIFALLFCFANDVVAQTTTGSILHDGLQRDYRLHLPPNLQPGSQPPLVFNLHGYTSNATEQEVYSGMNAVADTAGFVVCYPNGVNNAWNVGAQSGGGTTDDVGFIAALIDSLHGQHGINLDRVYACGMSNGGFFSYRLACELGERLAAIASVTGSMTTQLLQNCAPVRPVPVLEIHGTADPIVAFNGGIGIASIPAVVDFWASQNECGGLASTGNFPDVVPNDQATASFDIHTGCSEAAEVVLITIENGGHTWPGAFPLVMFGATCQDFNASSEIWNFFQRYQLGQPSLIQPRPVEAMEFRMFPNPFDHALNLELGEGASGFARVFDERGQLLWQGMLPLGIRTDMWPSGVYFVVLEAGGSLVVQKAVKR